MSAIAGLIKWDNTGDRQYETGCDHGVLYKKTGSTSGHEWEGYAWNGLTAVTESPSGAEASDLYADNIKYATLRSAEQFGFTIEAYTYPDEFASCDGSATFSDVAGVKIGQQSREKFGFCYRTAIGDDEVSATDSNAGFLLHIIWGATASPSERAYQTINDSPEAITFSWECTADPQKIDGTVDGKAFKPTCVLTIDSREFIGTSGGFTTAFQNLLDMLYGKDGTSSTGTVPYLPDPKTVLTTLGVTFDTP